jgi:hypothetical protein
MSFVLLGYQGYRIKEYMMRPYCTGNRMNREEVFNYRNLTRWKAYAVRGRFKRYLNGAGSVLSRNKKQHLKSLQFYIVTVSFSKFCISSFAQFIFNQSPCITSASLQHLRLPRQRTGALVPHCCSNLMIGVHGKHDFRF